MADAKPCPICGAQRRSDAPVGLCPHCRTPGARSGDSSVLAGPASEAGGSAFSSDDDRCETRVVAARSVPNPSGPTGDWSDVPSGPTRFAAVPAAASLLAPGETVHYFGDYEIRRELGRGGMGVVYEARQVSLNRTVALKMIKAGLLAGDDELRRFQNEAEAVAMLDHPGIVSAYEVGEHLGRHYLAMKLIVGGSLASMLERYRSDPRAAAGLLAEAAEAVHHAHTRGILHRDLKPANILIDTAGHPHITDFGLAKRLEADVEMTASGAIMGTPAYMAPEQATGRRGGITIATDVYGLGAVLYAVLTGDAPFGGDSLADTLEALRSRPPASPTRVNVGVPRDLETICLKCLEKDPRRRYASAQALADDLRAWLDSRPIAARRVGSVERARLWCRRRPAVAALSAAALVAIVGGIAATIAVQANANRELRAKNRELTLAYDREIRAGAELAAANERVAQRFALAKAAIKTFHTGVAEDFLLKQDQFQDLRTRLLKAASDFYGELGSLLGKETDPASRRALAASNFELADLTGRVGGDEAALEAHRAVLAARQALAAEPGADPELAEDVARSLVAVGDRLEAQGKTAEALSAYEQARDALGTIGDDRRVSDETRMISAHALSRAGWLLHLLGRDAQALDVVRQARDLRAELAAAAPGDYGRELELAAGHNAVGLLLAETGKPSEALAEYEAARAIREQWARDYPDQARVLSDLAGSHINIGALLVEMGKTSEARAAYEAARSTLERLVQDNPAVFQFQRELAAVQNNIGLLLVGTGKPSEALASYESARAIRERLVRDNPGVTKFRSDLAVSHKNIGLLMSRTGKSVEALKSYESARAIQDRLAHDNPDAADIQRELASTHANVGFLLSEAGRPADALRSFDSARAIQERLARDNPEVTQFQADLAHTRNSIGDMLSATGKSAEALDSYHSARAIRERLARDHPEILTFQRDLASTRNAVGTLLSAMGRPSEALTAFQEARMIRERLARRHPDVTRFRSELAGSLDSIGLLSSTTGRAKEAEAAFREALQIWRGLTAAFPDVPDYRSLEARSRYRLSTVLRRLGRPEEAREACDSAVALLEKLVTEFPGAMAYRNRLAYGHHRRGLARRDLGDAAGAAADARRALTIWQAVPARDGEDWFETACAHAVLSGLADSAADARAEADAAMAGLCKAVAMGYRNVDALRNEDALDSIRSRGDLETLILDLSMPADPFARGD
ncbi:MAG: serine/threonine-protein kinase [Isosphaeraceae bacterium]|nr:serine/threonine-protein kinase [Isosphaeraceae bacterium]